MHITHPNICAIVVTYHPEIAVLNQLLTRLNDQVSNIVIVDNSSNQSQNLKKIKSLDSADYHYIALDRNMGIAYAQNIGIEWAITHSSDYVLLMDQDSIPERDMVSNLLLPFTAPQNPILNTIAVGPTYVDSRNQSKSSFLGAKLGFPYRFKSCDTNAQSDSFSAVFLISSGSLISIPKLLQIGGMRSNYFIDHVDTEWCLRAKENGFSLIGQASAKMHHSLGDKVKKVWFLGWRSVSYHSPVRDYYMFRNTLLIIKNTKIPLAWSSFLLLRLIQFAIYFPLLSGQKIKRIKYMLLGIKHGISNIDGELVLDKNYCIPIIKANLDPST